MEYLFLLAVLVGIAVISIVLPLLAMSKVSSMEARVTRLSADLLALQEALRQRVKLETDVEPAASAPTTTSPIPVPKKVEPVTTPEPHEEPADLPHAVPPPPSLQATSQTTTTSTTVSLETIIGGKVLSRIGAVAIVLGALFFFTWAVDNNLITEAMRVAIGLGAGTAALVGGATLRNRGQHIVAQGVVAIGSSVLYLSVYAAFVWYALVPHPVAYFAMLFITLVSAWRAYVHHSPFLAALAACTGFLVPAMLPTDHPTTAGLFMHVMFIDALVIATIALRRAWQPLYVLAFLGTCLWQWLWYVSVETISAEQPVAPFMAAVFVAITLALVPLHRARNILVNAEFGATLWSIALMLFSLFFLFTLHGAPTYMADAAMVLVAATIYATGWSTRNDASLQHIREATSTAALGALLTTIYVHDAVAERILVAAIATMVATWLSLRDRTVGPRIVSAIVLVLACCSFMLAPSVLEMQGRHMVIPFVNIRFAAAVLTAASLLLVMSTRALKGTLAQVLEFAQYLPFTFLAFAIALEVHHWVAGMADRWSVSDWYTANHYYWLADVLLAAVFTVIAALLPVLARARERFRNTIGVHAVAILGMLTFLFHVIDIDPWSAYVFLTNVRVGAAIAIAVAFGVGWMASQGRTQYSATARWMAWGSVVAITFLTASFEAADPWGMQMRAMANSGYWDFERHATLESSQGLSVSVTWVVYAAILLALGFARRIRPVRLIGIAVLGVAILKVFVFDLQELETPYRILSFVALGLVLLSVSFFYGRLRKFL